MTEQCRVDMVFITCCDIFVTIVARQFQTMVCDGWRRTDAGMDTEEVEACVDLDLWRCWSCQTKTKNKVVQDGQTLSVSRSSSALAQGGTGIGKKDRGSIFYFWPIMLD